METESVQSTEFTPPKATPREPMKQQFSNSTKDPNYDKDEEDDVNQSNTGPVIILLLLFLGSILAMTFLYWSFPELEPEDAKRIKLPRNMEDAKGLGMALSNYKDDYFTQVLCGYVMTYIFLQSFAIPGSVFLSILSGFLFYFPLALFLVCLCSAVGATFCYLLSYFVGRRLVKRYLPERIKKWSSQVDHHRHELMNYIIFLRITPLLPNWLINIASPVINVPIWPFFMGTFIGVAPPSFGYISAGVEIHRLATATDAISLKSVSIVIVCGLLALLPVIFKRQLKKKLE